MNPTFLLGMAAATLTTSAFVPQVIKAVKTRQTDDLSLLMLLFTAAGVFLWMVYGIVSRQLPIILANGLTFLMAAYLALLVLRRPRH